jgi:hypothetical protein
MPASMSRMSAADTVGAGGAAPSPPAGVTLAVVYNAKRCRFCLRWSTETSPTPAACYPAWETLVPWGRGTLMKPLGFACKLCVVVPSPTYQLTCVLLTCHSLCSAVIHHMSPSLPCNCLGIRTGRMGGRMRSQQYERPRSTICQGSYPPARVGRAYP